MSGDDTPQADARKPEALLRLYLTIGVVAFTVILFLTGAGIHRIYSRHILNNAEDDAVSISRAVLEGERDFLIGISPAGQLRLEISKSILSLFDQDIRKFLQAFNIVKIKIYNLDSRILYSTDPTLIGQVDSGNARLKNALLGNNDSKLETKDKMTDLAGEQKLDLDVVETYVPVRAEGNILGSFEIYMDVTRYRAEITKVVSLSLSILAVILFFVFIPSFLLIRRGTLQLKQTQEELVRYLQEKRQIEKKQAREQLEYQASHDALTSLPNRDLLMDRIQQALLQARRHKRQVAVLFIDLDHFKFINDSLGHIAGDRLLRIVAGRLTGCVRPDDTVARQGGDDFVIVLPDLEDNEDIASVAQQIRTAVNQPVEIDAHDLEISCSIGISIYPKDGTDVQTLLKNADAAMFSAKDQGRDNFRFFTTELNDRAVARMTMEKELRRALEREEFLLHYQPQVDLATGRMAGMEALLRWRNPELGVVPPGSFIPLAEDTGLIVPIGEWVMREACLQNKAWQDAGLPPQVMAVNLSPRQFHEEDLARMAGSVLRESGLAPKYLELEVTESLVMRDVEMAEGILSALKKQGVRLAIDDFGTGYSSLGYIKRFPFDKLKIDLSFVRDITTKPESAVICRAIIALAHTLNLRVIAEGVETEGQLEYLRRYNCDEIQGYYFSRPLPAAEMEQLLREGHRLDFLEESGDQTARTLLLVDDEPQVIKTIERVLSTEGYRILSTTDPGQAFELLALNRVGVVLCDQRMPAMNGLEFLSRARELYPDTIRIAMSGSADMAMVTDAINQGAIYKFLTKPIVNDLLRQSIAKAFENLESAPGCG